MVISLLSSVTSRRVGILTYNSFPYRNCFRQFTVSFHQNFAVMTTAIPEWKPTEAFIREIPKTDLHMHLDGSLRLSTLIELAKADNITLPSYTEEGMCEKVFKPEYGDLTEYLEGFSYTTAVLRKPENCERIAYELAVDNFDEGVRYFEVRYAPQLLASSDVSLLEIMQAVDAGCRRAATEYQNKDERRWMHEGPPAIPPPPYRYGILVCGMKYFNRHFSPYYATLCDLHPHETDAERASLASTALVRAALLAKKDNDVKIVGLDLAGAEAGFPVKVHCRSYNIASRHLLNRTVHAGEAYGPESIFQAVTLLHAQRIGHGVHILDASLVKNEKNKDDAEAYVQRLVNYVASNHITLEVCLSSNLQTITDLSGDLTKHPLKRLMAHDLSICLNTDNRLVSHTTMCREIGLAASFLHLTQNQLRRIIITGFKRSFYPGSYSEKRRYVKQAIAYYDDIVKRHYLDA